MLSSVKASVRAVLVSSQNGISLTQFLRDYTELSGEALPYHKLGYTSAQELLGHMADVVEIRECSIGGQITLRGLSDRSTSHVDKLVSEQAVSKKDRKSHRRKGRTRMYNKHVARPAGFSDVDSDDDMFEEDDFKPVHQLNTNNNVCQGAHTQYSVSTSAYKPSTALSVSKPEQLASPESCTKEICVSSSYMRDQKNNNYKHLDSLRSSLRVLVLVDTETATRSGSGAVITFIGTEKNIEAAVTQITEYTEIIDKT